jgi:hypothetical protein
MSTSSIETGAEGLENENKETEGVNSESSTEEAVKETAFDAVMAALESPEEKSADSEETDRETPDAESAAARKEGDAADAEGDPSEEDLASWKPNTRDSFKRLQARRDEYRAERDALMPRANVADAILERMRSDNISETDIDQAFDFMSAVSRGDFQKAHELILPKLQQLAQGLGSTLPDDLNADVEQGAITTARARELAQARARDAHNETRRQQDEQRQTFWVETQRRQNIVDANTSALEGWSRKASQDPDWGLKEAAVVRDLKLSYHEQGYPETSADLTARLDQIKNRVDADFRKIAPRKREMRPFDGGNSGGGATPAPKSALEALNSAFGE